MSMTDPIADMLTRIRNATRVERETVDVPFSRTKAEVCEVLKREGYIREVKVIDEPVPGLIRVYLKYTEDGASVINLIQRESRPGRRVYRGVDSLGKVMDGMGIYIVTTSQGLLSDRECRARKVGGEVLCIVS